jgi:hypothetical protein
MSKAITERQEDPGKRWAGVEVAPSSLRADEPTVARIVGLVGACLVIFGGVALAFNLLAERSRISLGFASILLAFGVVSVLAHAAYDPDLQFRRVYWGLGVLLAVVGAFVMWIPFDGSVGGLFGLGCPLVALALLFLLAVLHHETDPSVRNITHLGILALGLVGAGLTFLLGNNFKDSQFLLPYGALLGGLSLAYLTAYVSQRGVADDLAYRVALGMGAVGLFAVVLGLVRGFAPASWDWLSMPLVPWGITYAFLGLLFLAFAVGICSDFRMVVMVRRELAAYFLSPIIYLILVGLTGIAFYGYFMFVNRVARLPETEPIVGRYMFGLLPVIFITFIVPILTMRLLSEEKRTGSLEVLLTAPVNEGTVVFSKFLAALFLYLLLWVPWILFLVALRIGGGVPFDYRQVFSFMMVQCVLGASFVSMGLFFSSLTQNQVASAVMTFAFMVGYLALYLLRFMLEKDAWVAVIRHVDYVDPWVRSLEGIIVPRMLLFHLSLTVVWLFLTTKVLQARRWA